MCAQKPEEDVKTFQRQDLSLNLNLGQQPVSPSNPPIPFSVTLGLQTHRATSNFLHGCWEPKLRSSCFLEECSYPLSPIFCKITKLSIHAQWKTIDEILVRKEKKSNVRQTQGSHGAAGPCVFSPLHGLSLGSAASQE